MLLAIDTSTSQVGLALFDGSRVIAELLWQSRVHHTQQLAPALQQLLERLDLEVDKISAVGVALGPGSFTSLRVGLAFCKGLVLARTLPLIGIPSLDVVAAALPPSRRKLAAVLEAGRGRLALAWYHSGRTGWQVEGPATVTTVEALAAAIQTPVIVCGELSAEDRQRLARRFKNVSVASPAQCTRRPGILAELAWQRWQAGQIDPPAALAPIYLHTAGGIPA